MGNLLFLSPVVNGLSLRLIDYLFHLFGVLFAKETVDGEITDVVLSMWMFCLSHLDKISWDSALQLYNG